MSLERLTHIENSRDTRRKLVGALAAPNASEIKRPANVSEQPSNFHIPCLDGIRGLAFLMVFVAHSGADRFVPGGLGVTIFFFLSGFLITTLLRRENQRQPINLKKFYLRRARRILPPIYICLVVGYALNHFGLLGARILFPWPGVWAVVLYYYNYAVIQNAYVALPLGMSVAWSLMIEEHFYLLFPPAYKYMLKRQFGSRKMFRILSLFCLVPFLWRFCLLRWMPGEHGALWAYKATDSRFDSILMGCILALAGNPLYEGDFQFSFLNKYKGLFAAIGLALIAASLLYRNEYFRATARYSLIPLALYPIFFYCIRSPRSLVSRALELRGLRELGSLSYTMYLTHLGVVEAFSGRPRISHFAVITAAFIVTLLIALIMRSLVENPLRRAFPI